MYYHFVDYDNALRDISRALSLNPMPEFYFARGNVYKEMGKYELAINDFSESININPYVTGAHERRGDVLYEMENYEEALADYQRALEINPHNNWRFGPIGRFNTPDLYYKIALVYQQINQTKKEREYLRHFVKRAKTYDPWALEYSIDVAKQRLEQIKQNKDVCN